MGWWRGLRSWLKLLARPLRVIPPWVALVATFAGAIFLAIHTRPLPPAQIETSRTWIAAAAALVLLVALLRGTVWLMDELGRPIESPRWQIRLFAGALLTLLAALNTHVEFDRLLKGLHVLGKPALGVSAVAGIGVPWERESKVDEAIRIWSDFATRETRPPEEQESSSLPQESTLIEPDTEGALKDPNAPLTVLAWAFGLDTALIIPSYFLVLGFILILGARSMARRRTIILETLPVERYITYRRAVWWPAIALVIALAADFAENYFAITLTTGKWFTSNLDTEGTNTAVRATILGSLTWIKLTAFFGALAYSALVGIILLRHRGPIESASASLWRTVLALRLQIIVVSVFAGALLVHEQVPDTIRRWSDRPLTGLLSVILAIVLSLVVWHSGRWMVSYAGLSPGGESTRVAWVVTALAALAAIFFGLPKGWMPTARTWVAPVILTAVVFTLSFPIRRISGGGVEPTQPLGLGRDMLPRILGAAVVVILGVAVLSASALDFLYTQIRGVGIPGGFRFTLGLSLLFASTGIYWFMRRRSMASPGKVLANPAASEEAWRPAASVLGSVLVWMLVMWLFANWGQRLAPTLGSVGVLAIFFVLICCTGSSVIALVDRLFDSPAAIFRLMGLRRAPVISLVVAWFLIASFLPFDETFHDVEPSGTAVANPHGSETLAGAFKEWKERNCLMSESLNTPSKPAIPLLFVAASGGGIRAAVWTSFVLDQMVGYPSESMGLKVCDMDALGEEEWADPSHALFALSGVSGGSLGFASYVATLSLDEPPTDGGIGAPNRPKGWIQKRLGEDFLAPSLAWMLFAEAPWSLLRFKGEFDRAEVLEQAWERPWLRGGEGLRQGLFALRLDHPTLPLLVLNGTSVETGCRFQTSVLNTSERASDAPSARCLSPLAGGPTGQDSLGATVDAVDFLCRGQDLPLSRAVLLSARFPVISPAGHVSQCDLLGNDPRPATTVVDGGYLENSGAGTALDLWLALESAVEKHNLNPRARACVVPFFVQINNGYGEPAPPTKTEAPQQFVAPITTANAARDGRTAGARQAAQLAFERPFRLGVRSVTSAIPKQPSHHIQITDRYAEFSLFRHPGDQAPLGWTLSEASIQDLRTQLSVDANEMAARKVKTWFTDLRCIARS